MRQLDLRLLVNYFDQLDAWTLFRLIKRLLTLQALADQRFSFFIVWVNFNAAIISAIVSLLEVFARILLLECRIGMLGLNRVKQARFEAYLAIVLAVQRLTQYWIIDFSRLILAACKIQHLLSLGLVQTLLNIFISTIWRRFWWFVRFASINAKRWGLIERIPIWRFQITWWNRL